MELDAALDFIRTEHNAVLATLRADGTPQLSPVLAGVDDDGHVVISTRRTAFKTRNMRRDPRVWLCVLPETFFGEWIQVDGEAEVVDLPEAMDGLIDYYRRISGEHSNWDYYRAAMEAEQRVLVRVRPTHAGPDHSG